MTYSGVTHSSTAHADAEEFSPLPAPALDDRRDVAPATQVGSVPLDDRERALAVGSELLAEQVYPVSDGRLISQGRLAQTWRRLQDALDSAPERAERAVDMRLRAVARRVLRRPAVVASLSPKGGTGKTTLAVLVGQLVSTRLRWPVLVLDTDFTGGTAREHIPSDGQTSATLVDALAAIRAGKIRGPADLLRYVCVIPGGAHLLAAPQDPAELRAIDVEAMDELVQALRVLYPVTIMDCAPGIGLRDSAQEFSAGRERPARRRAPASGGRGAGPLDAWAPCPPVPKRPAYGRPESDAAPDGRGRALRPGCAYRRPDRCARGAAVRRRAQTPARRWRNRRGPSRATHADCAQGAGGLARGAVGVMPRVIRESPRRTGAAALAVIAMLAIGWLAGAAAAGSTPRAATHIPTFVSTGTETVTQTVMQTVTQAPRRARPRGRSRRRQPRRT